MNTLSVLGLAAGDVVFLYLGMIRRYKGVPRLVHAFRRLEDPRARLIVAGRPATVDLRAEIEAVMEGDGRIKAVLEHVPDDEVGVSSSFAKIPRSNPSNLVDPRRAAPSNMGPGPSLNRHRRPLSCGRW